MELTVDHLLGVCPANLAVQGSRIIVCLAYFRWHHLDLYQDARSFRNSVVQQKYTS